MKVEEGRTSRAFWGEMGFYGEFGRVEVGIMGRLSGYNGGGGIRWVCWGFG